VNTTIKVLFAVSILGWVLHHLILRMKFSKLHIWGAIKYYLRFYCVFGLKHKKRLTFEQERHLKLKAEEERKKRRQEEEEEDSF